ncbi:MULTISPECIES: GNAT family N-acetyltransferase [unclassified Amycolatopsis]|uniref:GNAT family N-acetyltransferase n=1 Tax=unclassified Amycolatopsis TaxID=2618356 RepID=UPI0028766858|nr:MULTISPECIES: GNAT family N-acetyltransferase [unclassified Amycolatopsis]MDS0137342.1 GNAT family N-acetyltransferase [Amycolatopsis sp. 505]MDS0141537.1 GNAT family N-acetyltransferase [Amycolatopsis sp. CM201R]
MPDDRIRRIRPSDVEAAVGLAHELADYERAPDECHLTPAQLHSALFDDEPKLFGHVAEVDGEVVGFAVWFLNYSTWRGVHGIYLEDLYVRESQRGSGLGKALLAALAAECVANGYARLEWSVLDWNPATEFYKALGAVPMDEWTVNRLTDEPLKALAAQA